MGNEPPRYAPEVIGARLELAGRGSAADESEPDVSQVIVDAAIEPSTDYLLEEMAAADSLDIVGVLPWRCSAILMEITAQLRQAGQPTVEPSQVRYYTPARDRVIVYRHSEVLGPLVQRWIGGITGLRNWLLPRHSGAYRADDLLYEVPDLYLDCLVSIVKNGNSKIIGFTQLPFAGAIDDPRQLTESPLVITQLPDHQSEVIKSHIRKLASAAKPLVSRALLCELDPSHPSGPEGDEFVPLISALNRYDSPRPAGAATPVSVVVMLAPTAHGQAVLLKRRTRWNSREDFGTLSLVSERLLEEDFSEALAPPLSTSDEKALDELWLRMGRPRPFAIPEEVFRHAAQRELFMSCGLDIASNRMVLQGTCLLDREGTDEYIGFYVYTVELQRSSSRDEVGHALAWNPDLELVPVSELYSAAYHPRLNRLLRRRDNWLRRNVFVETGLESEGA